MAKSTRNGRMGPGMSGNAKRRVTRMLSGAANIRRYTLYDTNRFATTPGSTRYFGAGQGTATSAWNPAVPKTPADTNMLQSGRLNNGEKLMILGMFVYFGIRYVSFGATQANRFDDFDNTVKDIQQFEQMATSVTLNYGSFNQWLQVPLLMIPRAHTPWSTPYQAGRWTDMYQFEEEASLELFENTTISAQVQIDNPAALGSATYLVMGIGLHGIAFIPGGLNPSTGIQALQSAKKRMGVPG